MGIPKFYAWLLQMKFPGVLANEVPSDVSSFSLDLNGLLHNCAQLVYGYGNGETEERVEYVKNTDIETLENEYFGTLDTQLKNLIIDARPKDLLVLAVDGVAPYAKINQQRQRRFRSALDNPLVGKFDSNSITPGTVFMRKIDKFLQVWLGKNKDFMSGGIPLLPDKVIYSSHMEPGEGEHKIMDLMRAGIYSTNG